MGNEYRFDRYKRLRNMIIFAVIVSTIVFSATYFIFLKPEFERGWAKVWAKIHKAPQANVTEGENQIGACDDDCFLRLALTSANSTYCRNMSANRSEECWRMFSNSQIEACLELMNYSAKRECIGDFAFLEKNASLCGLLEGNDAVSCSERITPPCADLGGTGQQLCLAFRYNDSGYCNSTECFLTYATERHDAPACDGLSSDAEKYACRGVIKKTDECSLLSGVYTLAYCYQLLSQYSGDFSYCNKIYNGAYKYSCYLNAAIQEGDHSYCDNNNLEYIWNCYRNYTMATGDITGCLAIDEKYAKGSRDGCLRTFALKFSEPSACVYLSTVYARTNCYADVILQPTNLSLEKCSAVVQPDWKDRCFTQYAAQSNESSACDYIQSSDERARCEEKLAG